MFFGLPANIYFALHRVLAPAISCYRRLRPIARSPEPLGDNDRFALRLVPSEQLTARFEQAVRYLRRVSKAPVETYVEFGVYNGTSMSCMFSAFRSVGVSNPSLTGFDSFQGLPPGSDREDGGVWRVGQFSCPLRVTLDNLEALNVPADCVTLVEGWYADTLVGPSRHRILRPISIVMIDSDTYSSAQLALAYVEPFLCDPAIIFFDDWKLNNLDLKEMGEFRAFREFIRSRPNIRVMIGFGYNRKSVAALIRRVRT